MLLLLLLATTAAATATTVSCTFNTRFTVVSPRVIRLEYGPPFEDRSSVAFAHRSVPNAPSATVSNESALWCNISIHAHPFMTLSMRKIPDETTASALPPPFNYFHAHDLTITSQALVPPFTWRAAMTNQDPGNLGGTIRPTPSTDLSSCCTNPSNTTFDPNFPLQNGVVSRSGWSLLGNDDGPILQNGTGDFDHGWVLNRSSTWTGYDYHFFGCGQEYAQCLEEFVAVSGKMAVPTHRGLGVWWSRHWGNRPNAPFGPMTHNAIMNQVVHGYLSHQLPLDIVVCDMEWHDQVKYPNCDQFIGLKGWGSYSWNKTLFPSPDAFLQDLHDLNISLALNYHPDSDIDGCQDAYVGMAEELGVVVKKTNTPALSDLDASQWNQTYVDAYFTHAIEQSARADVAWTDTAQSTTWSNYVYTRYPALRKNKRVINFSRYGGIGDQRKPVGFSGDTERKWDTLAYEVYMTSRSANIGFGWWSHDIGGFKADHYLPHSNHTESAELFLRWLQFATYSPIFRTHCRYCDQRIWTFGDSWFPLMKATMIERNRLFPYINTHAHLEAYRKGRALLVPMYWLEGNEEEAYGTTSLQQYVFGKDFVVAPVVTNMASLDGTVEKKVWLPPGEWVAWNVDEGRNCGSKTTTDSATSFKGPVYLTLNCSLREMPVFLNASSIVPTRTMDNRNQPLMDPIVWTMFPLFPWEGDGGGAAEGRLYEDDGVSMDYHGQADVTSAGLLTTVKGTFNATTVCVAVGKSVGTFEGMKQERTHRFELRGVHVEAVEKISCSNGHAGTIVKSATVSAVVDCGPTGVHQALIMCASYILQV